MEVKIKYGLDKDTKKIKHISEVEKGEKSNCICIECGNTLIARKGKIQKHHFQHKSNTNCSGGEPETLLHKIGKEIIKDNDKILLSNDSFFDYSTVKLEEPLNDYKPDAIVFNNQGESWLIEIAVTHFVDDEKKEKIKRDQRNCIEITLHSDLISEIPEKIKNEVLNNPENREIIYDVKGIFDKELNYNSKAKVEKNWMPYIISGTVLYLFRKQIKRVLKKVFS
jgi:alpha-L-fucosidase